MRTESYSTPSGILVERTQSAVSFSRGLESLLRKLDTQRGIYFSSGYEYPGRYSRWDIASLAPPVEIVAVDREIVFRPLNARGEILNRQLEPVLAPHPHWHSFRNEYGTLRGTLKPLPALFAEEERSKQPSAFSMIRALIAEFQHPLASRLALAGAFGYDLLFRFDPIEQKLPRTKRAGARDQARGAGARDQATGTAARDPATVAAQGVARDQAPGAPEGAARDQATEVSDLRLFLCDDIYFMDRKKEQIERFQFDFSRGGETTRGVKRTAERLKEPKPSPHARIVSDHEPEEYIRAVEEVREGMRRGDYYEVVLRQTFSTPFTGRPSELFHRIQKASPSPYELLLQFGDEQIVGASPEMFVRVEGRRVETCPIAGTVRRTSDPLRDADNIRELLNSMKEESELTMCTDVDRNDKSRVCIPGSVRVIGRRLIESYAGLFHTVDHVEGTLAEGFDSLDAFLTHMWAVTVIGAPKKWAARAIENLEKDARGWYGGAVGMISLDGDINTGITIRTVHVHNGVARYGAGATLLYDSIPAHEDAECRLKATSFFRALQPEPPRQETAAPESRRRVEEQGGSVSPAGSVRLLLVDNEDCFIHTLANYARQTGAEVITYRAGFPLEMIERLAPSLILVSPGPGRPEDFGVPALIRHAAKLEIPVFGVCLGLQGMVEAFGGELGVLEYPMHGKPSVIRHTGQGVFEGLPENFRVGRYHSLYAIREKLPASLEITAETEDGLIMGVRHRELPMEAVQFHPESILTMEGDCGLKLMQNAVALGGRALAATSMKDGLQPR